MWFRSSLTRRRPGSALARRPALRTRLRVEELEQRLVLSGIDVVPGDPKDWPLYNHGLEGSRSSSAAPSRPMKGSGSGRFTDAAGGFFATGNATHLGSFTHYGTIVLTPTADPAVFKISGHTTYEAANGDKLYAILDGTLNVLTGVGSGTDTWAGGTGRFANASGIVGLSAKLLPDGTFTFTFDGRLAF